jgi:hypothetical protein
MPLLPEDRGCPTDPIPVLICGRGDIGSKSFELDSLASSNICMALKNAVGEELGVLFAQRGSHLGVATHPNIGSTEES